MHINFCLIFSWMQAVAHHRVSEHTLIWCNHNAMCFTW